MERIIYNSNKVKTLVKKKEDKIIKFYPKPDQHRLKCLQYPQFQLKT